MYALNQLVQEGRPCLLIADFQGNLEVYPLDRLEEERIFFKLHDHPISTKSYRLTKTPLSFEEYEKKFNRVIEAIGRGETYLLNLTQPTLIQTDASLQEIYEAANAPFKLFYRDQFVCFSPEPFITIEGNTIATFPMKGTIDASLPDAERTILANAKEMAEHIMVVDLLRNDLSMIASNVRVKRFRYIDTIAAGSKQLLQVSSHIEGDLPSNWKANFEELIMRLLPAGSISGTPKKSTLSLIETIEGYERGYFSGIFGVFDGTNFSSAVMIRYIEQTDQGLLYKSGGGITLDSNAEDEYQEMLDKIYIPQ